MRISSAAVSLNVPDEAASAAFAREHLGYEVAMADGGFVSLQHADVGFNLIFLRTGLPTFAGRGRRVGGPGHPAFAFVVDDLDAEFARIAAAGAQW